MGIAFDLTGEQFEHANQLLEALDPAPIVEQSVYDVCCEIASQLPDLSMNKLVQAAELARSRRERLRSLTEERFSTRTTQPAGVTRG